MAEPQPAQVREGADVEDEAPAIPSNAEDRKAAAALSSLGARGDDDDGPSKRPDIDQEALGQAISRLEVGSRVPGNSKAKGNNDGEVEKKKPAVKVDQADVALLVDELDLTKPKATELLKTHDGDAVRALRAFVTASV